VFPVPGKPRHRAQEKGPSCRHPRQSRGGRGKAAAGGEAANRTAGPYWGGEGKAARIKIILHEHAKGANSLHQRASFELMSKVMFRTSWLQKSELTRVCLSRQTMLSI
jgi:hypothetical protein